MKVVLTTVKKASVSINDKVVGAINRGYLLLVGFTDGDDQETVDKMVEKILSLRAFPDEHGQINISLDEVNGEILSISQFTLYANVRKGRRPSFVDALSPNAAQVLYDYLNQKLESYGKTVQTGIFAF